MLLSLAESVSRRLRDAGQCAGMVNVEIKYSDFSTISHQMQLLTPSQNGNTLYQYACRLFDEAWNGQPVRLLGIRTSKLSDADAVQMNLFDTAENAKLQKLDKALDDIRKNTAGMQLSAAVF
ncbi:MAG: hypothetical protein ACLSFZ_00345 [Frisingicoccus sp.]